jgi:hypothetical protein
MEGAPTAGEAEDALAHLRRDVLRRAAEGRDERAWHLALHGISDGAGDLIVTIRRLAAHEKVWRDSFGTQPVEPPIFHDPNENAREQMERGRADSRAFLLVADILLDDAVQALRAVDAPRKHTESLQTLAGHLESGGDAWSERLLPIADDLRAIQWSLGYFRDKFVVHRDGRTVAPIYLPDGRVRLGLVGGLVSPEDRARGGARLAEILGGFVPATPLEEVYDLRLDVAFRGMRVASPEQRRELREVLTEFGAVSPDPYETAVEIADVIGQLLLISSAGLGDGYA